MTLPLHRRAVVADTHNDLLMAVAARPPRKWASFFRERWLPQLVEGGVGLQILPVFIDDPYRPEGALRQTLRMIECAHVLAEGNPDAVRLCVDAAGIDEAIDGGRIALVLAMESMPGLDESVELISTVHRLGVRVA
ncbi:MAG: membrane dipeptidase, partial [Nonomuraea sp.]|nr:membrane dipeptidase [Nonomuraea sp.]